MIFINLVATQGIPGLPASKLDEQEAPTGDCLYCGKNFPGYYECAWVTVGARGWAHVFTGDCLPED